MFVSLWRDCNEFPLAWSRGVGVFITRTCLPRRLQSARIFVSPIDRDAWTSFTVRPWFDTVEDLQVQAFAAGTPSQRQQFFLDGKLLQDDGRVLALHGVVADSRIQLVSVCKDLLSGT